MTVEVIHTPKALKIYCSCGALLRYNRSDIKNKAVSSEGSYFFNMQTVYYIVCSSCKNDLILRKE